jgi:hypothetical protein
MQPESIVDVTIGKASSGSVRWTGQVMRPPVELRPAIRAREALAAIGWFSARGEPPFFAVPREVVYQKNNRLMVTPEVPSEGLKESFP